MAGHGLAKLVQEPTANLRNASLTVSVSVRKRSTPAHRHLTFDSENKYVPFLSSCLRCNSPRPMHSLISQEIQDRLTGSFRFLLKHPMPSILQDQGMGLRGNVLHLLGQRLAS